MTVESLSSSQQVGVHVLRDLLAQRPTVRRRRGGMDMGFPQALRLPLLLTPRPASFPVMARAPSSPAAPRHRESPAGGTACAKADLALRKDGAFPEQMKSSKTLSCQFEEAYAFCKFLES